MSSWCCMWQYSVVRIVREKMLRTEAFSDPEQLQAFLSQLYVFLVDEMHASLNKVMTQTIHFCYSLGEALLLLKLRLIDLNKPLTFIIKPWCFISVCIISLCFSCTDSDSVSGLSGRSSGACAELCSTQTLRQRGWTQHGLPAGSTVLPGGEAIQLFCCFNILSY